MLQLHSILNCHQLMNHSLCQLCPVLCPIIHMMTMTFGMSLHLQQHLYLNLMLHHIPLIDTYKQKAQLQIDHMAYQGQGDIVILLPSQRMAQWATSLLTTQRMSGHSLKKLKGKFVVWCASESLNDVMCSLLVSTDEVQTYACKQLWAWAHNIQTWKLYNYPSGSFHLNEWVEYCDKHGIPTKWKDTEAATNSYCQKYGQKSKSSKPTECKKFSNEAFVDALVAFIVQDDQVQLRLTCTIFY